MGLEITDIRTCWERIRPGLKAIRKKCEAEWRLEDVYAKCVSGEWTLFTDEGVEGFVILCQYPDPYQGGKRLFVECAYYRGDDDPFEVYEPLLLEVARSIGAHCLEFRSPRTGFRKKGWAVADIVYRKEVI